MKPRGLSLLEAIISIFILTGGSLACFTLLLQAFRYQGRTQHVSDATIAGEQMLESLRRWAQQPANFDNQWALYSNQDLPSFNPPGFNCHISVSQLQAPGDVLTPCYRLVTIEVRDSQRVVTRLTGQIGSPLRKPDRVKVYPEVVGQLRPNQSTQFWAYLLDANSKPVPGVRFDWLLIPEGPPETPGDATLDSAGADRVSLTHLVYGQTPPDPNKLYTPGKVRVHAICHYRAAVYEADSAQVELLPPP